MFFIRCGESQLSGRSDMERNQKKERSKEEKKEWRSQLFEANQGEPVPKSHLSNEVPLVGLCFVNHVCINYTKSGCIIM
jgi:hypothetical protein